MIFTEPRFFLFYAAVFTIYWVAPWHKFRKVMLLVASCVFYSAWDWRLLGLILFSTSVDYLACVMLGRIEARKSRVLILLFALITNLGLLGFFKYYNFFVYSAYMGLLNLGIDPHWSTLNIVLPIGISFYTFHTLSYTFDVYRRKMEPIHSPLDFALFVMFFPYLVAGPIVRAVQFLPQLVSIRRWEDVRVRWALTLFTIGFFKKACVADNLAVYVDQVYAGIGSYDVWSVWIANIFYVIQVYCDFSGYSDMAVGAAALLGFKLPLNFYFPYFASNASELWQRWHITLTSFIRDYVFIPLGGTRVAPLKLFRNVLLTMFLVGLWHGASWSYVLFGLVQGVYMILDRAIRLEARPLTAKYPVFFKCFGIVFTFYWWIISCTFFRGLPIDECYTLLQSIIYFHSPGEETLNYWLILWFVPLFLLHLYFYINPLKIWYYELPGYVFTIGFALWWLLMLPMVQMDYKPFIYFQF